MDDACDNFHFLPPITPTAMGKDKEKKSKKSKEETEDAGAAAEAMDVDASPAKGKEKKARESMGGDADEGSGPSYESRLKALSPIAQPLASKKLTKKLLKVVKKCEHDGGGTPSATNGSFPTSITSCQIESD